MEQENDEIRQEELRYGSKSNQKENLETEGSRGNKQQREKRKKKRDGEGERNLLYGRA